MRPAEKVQKSAGRNPFLPEFHWESACGGSMAHNGGFSTTPLGRKNIFETHHNKKSPANRRAFIFI
jgi:hypothetical protein